MAGEQVRGRLKIKTDSIETKLTNLSGGKSAESGAGEVAVAGAEGVDRR